jgi:hypothetical protein
MSAGSSRVSLAIIHTESLSGNGDHCLEPGQSSKVDRVQSKLNEDSQAESIDGDAALGFNLAQEVREKKSTTGMSASLSHACSVR